MRKVLPILLAVLVLAAAVAWLGAGVLLALPAGGLLVAFELAPLGVRADEPAGRASTIPLATRPGRGPPAPPLSATVSRDRTEGGWRSGGSSRPC